MAGIATRGADYVIERQIGGTWAPFTGLAIIFAANESSLTLRIKSIHDAAVEAPPGQPEEFVTVTVTPGGILYAPSSTNGSAQVTIIDNDGQGAGWLLVVGSTDVPPTDYTEWELKSPGAPNFPGYYYERQKVVATWEEKGTAFYFQPSTEPQSVTAGFDFSEGTSISVSSGFSTAVEQTLIKDWLTIGATLSGDLSYTVTQNQAASPNYPISLVPGQAARAVPMVLVLRTVRQAVPVASASVPPPQEGAAGESAVEFEQASGFSYTSWGITWTTSTLESDRSVFIWKTIVQ